MVKKQRIIKPESSANNIIYSLQSKKLLFEKFSFYIWQIFNWKSRHASFPRRDCTHTKIFINTKCKVSCTYSLDRLFNERPKKATTTKRDHSITEHFLGFFQIYCHLSFVDDTRMKQKSYRSLPATPAETMCTWVESGLKILFNFSLQFEYAAKYIALKLEPNPSHVTFYVLISLQAVPVTLLTQNDLGSSLTSPVKNY